MWETPLRLATDMTTIVTNVIVTAAVAEEELQSQSVLSPRLRLSRETTRDY